MSGMLQVGGTHGCQNLDLTSWSLNSSGGESRRQSLENRRDDKGHLVCLKASALENKLGLGDWGCRGVVI